MHFIIILQLYSSIDLRSGETRHRPVPNCPRCRPSRRVGRCAATAASAAASAVVRTTRRRRSFQLFNDCNNNISDGHRARLRHCAAAHFGAFVSVRPLVRARSVTPFANKKRTDDRTYGHRNSEIGRPHEQACRAYRNGFLLLYGVPPRRRFAVHIMIAAGGGPATSRRVVYLARGA